MYVNGDMISQLPSDKSRMEQVPEEDMQVVNTVFHQSNAKSNSFYHGLKEAAVAGLIFILFSVPQIDGIFKKFIPMTANSPYMLIFVKAIGFVVVFWIVKNFLLNKKG